MEIGQEVWIILHQWDNERDFKVFGPVEIYEITTRNGPTLFNCHVSIPKVKNSWSTYEWETTTVLDGDLYPTRKKAQDECDGRNGRV